MYSENYLLDYSKMTYQVADKRLTGIDEANLILSAQAGDVEAFNRLVINYRTMIYNLTARILGDADLADDITQNTFLTAYLNLPRFRNGSFRSWLYRIATNACYDEHRKNHKVQMSSIDSDTTPEERLLPLENSQNPKNLPEVEFEHHELELVIQNALNQLDAVQRTVVVLVDLQDFDYLETAQILRIPIGTVKSRLARARLRMRNLVSASMAIN